MDLAGSGAEWRLPPWTDLASPALLLPFLVYFLIFQLLGIYTRRHAWRNHVGFKHYRLCNLTVCMVHATITGLFAFCFLFTHSHVMFEQTLHWYSYSTAQIPIFSIAYFAYDMTDLLRHESSRWTRELLLHHAATLLAFISSILARKFLAYMLWALLMEVNSVVLHSRTLMQLSGHALTHPHLYRIIRVVNLLTFIIFRFLVQIWQIAWAWNHRNAMHIFYALVGILGGIFFFVLNCVLFLRVLAADGHLGDYGKRHTAIQRSVR